MQLSLATLFYLFINFRFILINLNKTQTESEKNEKSFLFRTKGNELYGKVPAEAKRCDTQPRQVTHVVSVRDQHVCAV